MLDFCEILLVTQGPRVFLSHAIEMREQVWRGVGRQQLSSRCVTFLVAVIVTKFLDLL